MPLAYWIGRVCEEFRLPPSAAYHEWMRAPCGFIEDVIEARGYARTKAAMDAATSRKAQPTGPLADRVREIEFELAQEEIEERTRNRDG